MVHSFPEAGAPRSGREDPRDHHEDREDRDEERSTERRDVSADTRDALRDFDEDLLRTLNTGSNVPLDEEAARLVLKQNPNISRATALEAFRQKQWGKGLKHLIALFFGTRYAIQGTGFELRDLDQLPLRHMAGLITQLTQRDQQHISLEDKTKRAMLHAGIEMALEERGYERTSEAEPVRSVPIDRSMTVGEYLTAEQPTVLPLLQDSAGDPDHPPLLGSLPLSTTLTPGMHLYLNADGLPLCVMERAFDANTDRTLRFPLFRYNAERQEEQRQHSRLEQRLSFLERHVRRGDVLMVSQDGDGNIPEGDVQRRTGLASNLQRVRFEALEIIQRRTASSTSGGRDPHHGTHVMVFDGTNVLHVSKNGPERTSIREAFFKRPYNAVTVLHLRDEAAIEPFVSRAEEYFGQIRSYNVAGLFSKALNQNAQTDQATSCVCSDLVTRGLPFTTLRTPQQILNAPDFVHRYTLEMGKTDQH